MDSSDPRNHALDWFKSTSDEKVNVTRIGEALGVSRNTARSRLDDGLSADDIITVARAFKVNPTRALQELGLLTIHEVFEYMDADGTLLSTASQEQLIYRLAEDLPLSDLIQLGAIAKERMDRYDEFTARRLAKSNDEGDETTPAVEPLTYDPERMVAYSGPDEDKLREIEEHGENYDWTDPNQIP